MLIFRSSFVGVKPGVVSLVAIVFFGLVVVGSAFAGTVSFGLQTNFETSSRPMAVVTGDVDRDGNLDVVTADTPAGGVSPSMVSVLLGKGDGTFRARKEYEIADDPTAAALGDLNRDGNLDIVTSTNSSNTISVLLGRGDGTFNPKKDFAVTAGKDIALGDVDRDGSLDVVAVNSSGVYVLSGRGDGTLDSEKLLIVRGPDLDGPSDVALGDVNRDGNLDVVTASFSGSVSVMTGKGDGTLNSPTAYPIGVFTSPDDVVLGDLNNDGKLDVVTSNDTGHTVSVLLGKGDGTLNPKADYPAGFSPMSVALADFDKDGNLDALTADAGTGKVQVLTGVGDGTLNSMVGFPMGVFPEFVAVGDVNNDGYKDIISSTTFSGGPIRGVGVLLNELAPFPVPEFSVDSGREWGVPVLGQRGVPVVLKCFDGPCRADVTALVWGTNTDGRYSYISKLHRQTIKTFAARVPEASTLWFDDETLAGLTDLEGCSAVTRLCTFDSTVNVYIHVTVHTLRSGDYDIVERASRRINKRI